MVTDADAEQSGRGSVPDQGIAVDLARESFQRPWYSQVTAYLLWVLVTVPAVWICDWLLSGFHTDRPWGPLVFAAVMGLVGVLVQPVLVGAALLLGWVGVFLLTLVGQALVVLLAGWILPNVTIDDFWTAFVVAIVIGLTSTVLGWL